MEYEIQRTMRETGVDRKRAEMKIFKGCAYNELDVLLNIIRGCFNKEPEARPTAKQIIKNLQ